ncbi:transcription factor IIIC subunit delta N-term-domain-containing protein [Mycena rosella]|uniref:Transcription factor IIIC subunit delta N-term-domain-containing protein n=1 Tax=Mycena rosella TaxID=1033263 RepID=A0AAD7H088_MYCRO|nr:transcription factor IIIC subunit delta N-term-domain-containing protein [Mycena rosella]
MPAPASQICSVLNIPSITSRPSLSCLQWSGDGQVFFLTKGSVYVLTPDRGIHSGVHSGPQPPGDVDHSHVKWFSTMIDFNPREVHNWPAGSQDYGAVSLGSMDVGLRAISCSPSDLTGNGGCVAAILSSNMDLSLWHTPKNTMSGEWVKLCDITPFTEQTLRSQIISMAWSSHADFDISPAPRLNTSLLVTGTRAGTLMLFRYNPSAAKDDTMEHVATHEVESDQWITHIALSPWMPVEGGESEIKLAYGIADGSVGLVKITQSLCAASSSSGFSLNYTIQTRVEKIGPIIFQPDNTGITALSWIFPIGNMIVVRTTPGVVSLWSGDSPTLGWSGQRSLRLCTQKLSVGSSSLQPVSGLHYVPQEDTLLVSLFDGSIHAIQSLIEEPRLANVPQNSGALTSLGLSRILRSAFTRTEKEKVSKLDVNRISGLIPYDESSVFLWVQESAQPSNFEYKYDVLHQSTCVGKRAARLFDSPPHDALLRQLSSILMTKASSGATPLHLLRPIFLRFQDLLDLQARVLETLLADADRFPPSPILVPWSSDSGPQLRAEFRKNLNQHLFGCNVLHSLRLRLAVADFCWRNTADLAQADEYGDVAQQFLRTISFIVLIILCRHFSAVITCLRENDIPFLMRIALQSSLPCAPPALRAEAEALLNAVPAHIPSFSREMHEKQAMEETCPACGLIVYFDGESDAVCPNGHSWGRCAVTSFILTTPMLRTCAGCARKTFLPRSFHRDPDAAANWLPPAATSWVVEELLEAVSRCLFCGNNLMSLF